MHQSVAKTCQAGLIAAKRARGLSSGWTFALAASLLTASTRDTMGMASNVFNTNFAQGMTCVTVPDSRESRFFSSATPQTQRVNEAGQDVQPRLVSGRSLCLRASARNSGRVELWL